MSEGISCTMKNGVIPTEVNGTMQIINSNNKSGVFVTTDSQTGYSRVIGAVDGKSGVIGDSTKDKIAPYNPLNLIDDRLSNFN